MPALGIMFRCQYPPDQLVGFARQAEQAGFDEFWVVEDCFWGGGIASSAIALAHTQRISVALGIMPAVARNAAFAAMEIATLARLYPGRFLPGFGHGVADWMRQVAAFPASQLAALEETTDAVRALLRGEIVTMQGQHVHLDQVKLDLPPQPVPLISLGVRGPKSLQLSGRVADGTIIPETSAPAYVRWAREQIGLGMQAAGRTQHRLTVYAWCCVDEDGAAAKARIRPVLANVLASSDFKSQVIPLDIANEIQAMLDKGGKDYLAQQMPEEWLSMLAAVGTPQEGAAYVTMLAEAGADSVVLVPLIDQSQDQFELISQQMLPILRS